MTTWMTEPCGDAEYGPDVTLGEIERHWQGVASALKRERDEARTALSRVIQERDAALLAASEGAPSGEPSEEAINKSFEFLNMRLCEFGDKAEMRNLLRAAYAIDAMRPASDGWSKAARDVLAERQRQAEVEGYTPEHDREHRRGGGPMNDAEKIAPDYSRHEPSDAAWSAACVAYATTVGRAKLAEAIRAAYEVDDVRPAAITAAVEAEREAIAATHDAEIARLQKQIEENNAYMARVSNMTPENTLAGESRANKFCRDQLRWHERFAASIRARKGEASNGNVG